MAIYILFIRRRYLSQHSYFECCGSSSWWLSGPDPDLYMKGVPESSTGWVVLTRSMDKSDCHNSCRNISTPNPWYYKKISLYEGRVGLEP